MKDPISSYSFLNVTGFPNPTYDSTQNRDAEAYALHPGFGRFFNRSLVKSCETRAKV